uniref:Uncharacterized protein n=1 Tax=Pediastrum duplex TaxID=3105 RepID=A0A2U8GIP6_PEDDU|nr:hypothetical protein [Pediastrum duplex]
MRIGTAALLLHQSRKHFALSVRRSRSASALPMRFALLALPKKKKDSFLQLQSRANQTVPGIQEAVIGIKLGKLTRKLTIVISTIYANLQRNLSKENKIKE